MHRIIYKSIHARHIGLYVFRAEQIERMSPLLSALCSLTA